jgi:histidine ammonia-lyase
VIAQRVVRFTDPFFTVISPSDGAAEESARAAPVRGSEFSTAALMQEIQGLINPVPPEGNALIKTVEDLQTQTRLKVERARTVVMDTIDLLAEDLLTGTSWLDLRKAQNPARGFGSSSTEIWTAFRKILPLHDDAAPARELPIHELAAAFIRGNAAANFYRDDRPSPAPRPAP